VKGEKNILFYMYYFFLKEEGIERKDRGDVKDGREIFHFNIYSIPLNAKDINTITEVAKAIWRPLPSLETGAPVVVAVFDVVCVVVCVVVVVVGVAVVEEWVVAPVVVFDLADVVEEPALVVTMPVGVAVVVAGAGG